MSSVRLKKGEDSVVKTFRLSETDLKKLDYIAKKEGSNRSNMLQTEVKNLIARWEKKHGTIKI